MILIHIIDNQLKSSSLKLALKPPPWEGLHFASCNKHRHRSLESRTVHLDLRSNLPARDFLEKGAHCTNTVPLCFSQYLCQILSALVSLVICDKLQSFLQSLDWGKICRKPWFLPLNMEVSCKFSHHPILWLSAPSHHEIWTAGWSQRFP